VSECAYRACSKPWAICRCCYRGHRYCSEACSQLARLEKKREYNGRHQQGRGRKHHRGRQRAYRWRQASGACSEKIVTDQSSIEPSSDGTLDGAKRQEEVVLSTEDSVRASEANQDDWPRCRCCGRRSVLVEPLSERRRIVLLLQRHGRSSAQSTKGPTGRGSFAGYVEAIGALYAELRITPRRLRRDELEVARQLYREGVRSLHIEAAWLVTTARRLLGNEPQPAVSIRSMHDVVPLIKQARRAGVGQGYVDYLRLKLREVLEAYSAASAKPRTRPRSSPSPRR